MKKTFLLILIIAIAVNSYAQNPHERTLKLFKLMQVDHKMDLISSSIMKMYTKQGQVFAHDPNGVKLKQYIAFTQNEVKAVMPKIMNDMIPVYESYFTQQEIQQYIDFYSTPAGKKLIGSSSVLQGKMSTIMIKYLPAIQQKLKGKMKEMEAIKK